MKRWLTRRWFMMFAGGASPALLGAASRASSAGEVHTVSARGITVRLSADGDILGAVCDGHECHLTGGTRLDGCERVGEARATVRGDGAVEVRRTLRRASAGSTLVLLDRFLPHGDSVRWEIEITSDDAPGRPRSKPPCSIPPRPQRVSGPRGRTRSTRATPGGTRAC